MLPILAIASFTLGAGGPASAVPVGPESKYVAYWLFDLEGNDREYGPVLLLARQPIGHLKGYRHDGDQLLEAPALTALTYQKAEIWNRDRRPLKVVRDFGGMDVPGRRISIDGKRYRYEDCPLAEVVRLLEHPESHRKLHRLNHPLTGAEQTARAIRLFLAEQLRSEAEGKK